MPVSRTAGGASPVGSPPGPGGEAAEEDRPLPVGHDEAAAQPAPAPRSGRRGRSLFVLALSAASVLRVVLAISEGGPILADDGLGYLGNARWIAGVGEPSFAGSHFYSAGYSFLLAVLYRLGLDHGSLVVAVQVVNALLATLVAVPLGAVVAQMSPRLGGRAYWIGLVVSLLPALLLQPAFVWPESLLPLLFATWTMLLLRLGRSRRGAALLLAGVAVISVAVHARTLGLVVATAVVLVVATARRLRNPAALVEGLAAIAVLAGGVALERAFTDRVVEALWGGSAPSNAGRAGSMVDRLQPDAWADVATAATGQLWYVAAGTAGLGLVGLVFLLGTVASRARSRSAPGEVLPWVGLLLGIVVLAGASVLFTAGERVDHVVYGRYNETWLPVVTALGLGWVASARLRPRLVAAALVVVGIIGGAAVLSATLPPGRMSGDVMVLNVLGVAGVEALLRPGAGPLLGGVSLVPVSLVTAGAFVAIALVACRTKVLLAATAAMFLVTGVGTHVALVGPFRDMWFDLLTSIPAEVEQRASSPTEPIDYDLSGLRPSTRNVLQFWLGDDRVRFVDSAAEARARFVVSQDTGVLDACYEPVVTQRYGSQILWERDGPCDDGTGGASSGAG